MFLIPSVDLEFMLNKTNLLYESIRGQTLFITGGTGFFGKWVVGHLLHANQTMGLNLKLVILTRNMKKTLEAQPHLAQPLVFLVEGDVRNIESLKMPRIDHILHMATEASATFNEGHPSQMLQTIWEGGKSVIQLAKEHQVKSILFTSSGAVYGPQPSELTHMSESYLGAPSPFVSQNPYAMGKYLSECLFSVFSKETGIPVKIARCFAFVGPHLPLDAHFAIGNFIRDGLLGKNIEVQGDGTPTRSYLYASDLVIWLMYIWLRGDSCRPYNVGSGESLSLREVAEAVSKMFEHSPQIDIKKVAQKSAAIARYVPDVTRAKEELGLDVYTSLPTAINKTVEFFS